MFINRICILSLLHHLRCGDRTSGWSATATRLRSVLRCGQTLKRFISSEPLSLRGLTSTPIPIWWSGIEIKKAKPALLEIERLWKIQRFLVKFVLVLWYACLFVWVLFQNVVNQHAMEPKVLTVHISWNPRRYPLGFGLQYLRVFDDLKKSNQETRQTFCHEVFVYSCRNVQFGWVMGWI